MDTSENTVSRALRRSTRQSSKALNYEPTPRGPLKRTKKASENRPPVSAVNGSKDVENGTEDEDSPSKKRRLEAGDAGGSGDENEMDLEKDGDQEMDIEQDSSEVPHQTINQSALGDVNVFPRVVLGERCPSSHVVHETKAVNPSAKGRVASTKFATQIRSPSSTHDVSSPKFTSMDEYKVKMEAKVKSIANHQIPSTRPASEESFTTRLRLNNIPTQKQSVQHKKQGIKKTTVIKTIPAHSSKGVMWYFWRFLLFSSSAVLLAYWMVPVLQKRGGGGNDPSRALSLEKFTDHVMLLQTQFSSQRPELWRRSRIHLERHLKTAQPTEPVSLIFTAGLSAERTLHCLAQGLASSFSSALNASVLHLDGASKASQDSDEVKLYIDSKLQGAFEGDKPVAVIHRFEELPPGSTLIFYRYCDHENAAYKRVFLLFTVLLPQDEVRSEKSLKEVEEMVQDYVKEKLVGSSSQTAFNTMDIDKFGGLWSRISHLILPVVAEEEVEQKGC